MRKFNKYIIIYLVVIIVSLLCFAYIVDLSGWSDDVYKRIRSSGEKSLIIGTSRAGQGIHPDIINKKLEKYDFCLPIYNFAFGLHMSPYGEVYHNAIKKKLSKEIYSNGLFILSVDPFGLSTEIMLDKDQLRENNHFLAEKYNYIHPNFIYIWKNARKTFKRDSNMILNNNGWLEINVPMDSASIEKRIIRKKKFDSKHFFSKSQYRLKWLTKTISFLKQKGTVFLVRIPASSYMWEYENKFWPEFEKDISNIAKTENIEYISFKDKFGYYKTTDENHLYKDDGARFTNELCDSISKRLIQKSSQSTRNKSVK
jgi:hypothetical protein